MMVRIDLDETQATALQNWISAAPDMIRLPDPSHTLARSHGVMSVAIRLDEIPHIAVVLDPSLASPAIHDRITALANRIVENAVRLAQFVPRFWDGEAAYASFVEHDWLKDTKTPISCTLAYSCADYVILLGEQTNRERQLRVFFLDNGKRDFRTTDVRYDVAPIVKATVEGPENEALVEAGLCARDVEDMDRLVFRFARFPAILSKITERNVKLLRGHTLEAHLLMDHEILYVDEDIVYSAGIDGRDYYIAYRREGYFEKRRYDTATGRRHADRADKAMKAGAGPGNAFRKWADKQRYDFDVAPHSPRN